MSCSRDRASARSSEEGFAARNPRNIAASDVVLLVVTGGSGICCFSVRVAKAWRSGKLNDAGDFDRVPLCSEADAISDDCAKGRSGVLISVVTASAFFGSGAGA